jgi:hypothetical protein
VNYAINQGRNTEGGITGALDKIWDMFKDIFQKQGIEKSHLENGVRNQLKEEDIEKEIKIMEKEAKGNELTNAVKIERAKSLLNDYYELKKPKMNLLKEIGKDLVDFALKTESHTKTPWKAIKVTHDVFQNKIVDAILHLDPTGYVGWIKRAVKYGAAFENYLGGKLIERFLDNFGYLPYINVIKGYYLDKTIPLKEVAEGIGSDGGYKDPRGKLIAADLLYWETSNPHKHIISEEFLNKYPELKDALEGKI